MPVSGGLNRDERAAIWLWGAGLEAAKGRAGGTRSRAAGFVGQKKKKKKIAGALTCRSCRPPPIEPDVAAPPVIAYLVEFFFGGSDQDPRSAACVLGRPGLLPFFFFPAAFLTLDPMSRVASWAVSVL